MWLLWTVDYLHRLPSGYPFELMWQLILPQSVDYQSAVSSSEQLESIKVRLADAQGTFIFLSTYLKEKPP
ncbi:hypothetical protein C5L39_07575 [Corynebacterium alimapuense]|uniref:Uncharacterized protein n=1 Tax=Corynebacterium alimapuense TaxID=1576874 RepID=A0A3M8K6J6_9CORY|nr:hypothetical protein C5L39_07575 [Corynebacterium alimapuense]